MESGRKRSRVQGHFEAVLAWAGLTVPVVTENLSLKGMQCLAPQGHGLKEHDACVVRLTLSSDALVQIESQTMRVQGQRLALRFMNMDAASFAHLRNLVRYSAHDPDAIDSELGLPSEQEE